MDFDYGLEKVDNMQARKSNGSFNQGGKDGQVQIKSQLEQAMAALRTDDVDAAERILNDLVEEQPQVPQIYLALARCALQRGRPDSALEYVQTALSLKEDLPNAYNLRGKIYLAQEEDAKAFADFQKAIELKPALVNAHISLAQLYLADEQLEPARYHCETALEYEPHRDSLRLMLCNIHEQTGDIIAAQEEALAAVQANPGNVAAYLKQGMISFKQRDLLQAEKSFEGLLEVKPDSMMGYFLLGVSALGLEKYQLAERSLKQAQQLTAASDQNLAEAEERIMQQLVRTYMKQGKHQQALGTVKKLIRRSRSKWALKTLADIYYEMGQYELANQQYRAILLSTDRLSAASPELRDMLDFKGSPIETSDAWRAGFDRLRSRQGTDELPEPVLASSD